LLSILNNYFTVVGVSLNEPEKLNLYSSVENMSELIGKASFICSERLASVKDQ
jgi:hypothetical protein